MNNKEKKVLKDFLIFCGTTSKSEARIKKIEWIMVNSRKIIEKDITKLEIKDVVLYLQKLNNGNYSLWTKNDYKKIFKRFLKWYYKDLELVEGLEVKQGFQGVSKHRAFNKGKINKNTLVKAEEFEKLMRAADNLKWKAIISVLYESALRPCELVNLKWKDIKFKDSEGICSITTLSPKTKELRTIPIKENVVDLKRWEKEFQFSNLNKEDYVFPSQFKREEHLSAGSITTMFRRLSKKAKIRNIFPYMFRHSRIYYIQKKLGARMAAKYAGHSLETSEIYDHLDSDDVEEAMMKNVFSKKELTKEEKNEIEELKKKLEERDRKDKLISNELKELQQIVQKRLKIYTK